MGAGLREAVIDFIRGRNEDPDGCCDCEVVSGEHEPDCIVSIFERALATGAVEAEEVAYRDAAVTACEAKADRVNEQIIAEGDYTHSKGIVTSREPDDPAALIVTLHRPTFAMEWLDGKRVRLIALPLDTTKERG